MQRVNTQGFTLIEILIVMVIISIVSGIALMTITSNQHKQLEQVAKKLSNLITLAEHQALLQPATLGLGMTQTSYQFFQFSEDNSWQSLNDKNFASHTMPAHVQLSLKIHDKTIPLNGKPTIIISESGDITPFVIFIAKTGEKPFYQVIGDASGKISSGVIHEK